jgi:DGQHR domain-containing protein
MVTRFTSAKDMTACIEYCDRLIHSKKSAEMSLEYFSKKLELEPYSSTDVCREFWDSFLEILVRSYQTKDLDDIKLDYPWGCWLLGLETPMEETPTLWEGVVSRHDQGAYQIHTYDSRLIQAHDIDDNLGDNFDDDGKIVWKLLASEQQGREVLVGAITVGEIDAVCRVPHLPNFAATNQGSMLLAKWSLQQKKGLTQWQRRPNPKRIQSISNFMEAGKNNLIINSIMLYIPEDAPGVTIEKEGNIAKITIDPKQFLVPIHDKLTDVTIKEEDGIKIYIDHRPIWIVDGQHRTRGMALSERGARLDVPVIITHGGRDDSIGLEEVAKVFTEINTLAKPLDSFQQHYLSHKFSIVASEKDKTYGIPAEGIDEKDRQNRRTNIRLYQLASMLTADKNGPFENGVQLVDGEGSARMIRIKFNEFAKQMRPLFMTGIYSDPDLTMEEIHADFSDYLSAWSKTANFHKWKYLPNRPRWRPNYGHKSELEGSQAVVWIIFKTFTFIRNVIETRGLIPSEAVYTDILAPIRGIDWYSRKLGSRFEKQYRPASEYMSTWIRQAILFGEIRTPEDVQSFDPEEVHHGTALYANPSTPVISSNHGAIATSITLTWDHGNIYKEPDECHILFNSTGDRYPLEDVVWDFTVPDGLSADPSIARYTINIENYDDEDWVITVNTRCIKATHDLVITPDMLGELVG